ncbi:Os02g0315200, partial [Oryza sativa Japonica Group]
YDLAPALSPHRPVSPRLLGTLLSRLPDACRGVALLDLLAPDLPTSALLILYNLLLCSTCRAGCSASPPASSWICGTEGSPPTRSRTPRSSRRSPARATSTTHSPFCHSWRTTPWLPTSCSSPTSSTSPSARATRPRRSRSSPVFGARGAAGIKPDLKAYNAAIAAYCKSDLLRDTNRLLLHDMPSDGVAPDAESYSPMRRAGVAPSPPPPPLPPSAPSQTVAADATAPSLRFEHSSRRRRHSLLPRADATASSVRRSRCSLPPRAAAATLHRRSAIAAAAAAPSSLIDRSTRCFRRQKTRER